MVGKFKTLFQMAALFALLPVTDYYAWNALAGEVFYYGGGLLLWLAFEQNFELALGLAVGFENYYAVTLFALFSEQRNYLLIDILGRRRTSTFWRISKL